MYTTANIYLRAAIGLQPHPLGVLCMSVAVSCRQTVAAAVEGQPDILLLECRGTSLQFCARLELPGAQRPSCLAACKARLWAAEGCEDLLPLSVDTLDMSPKGNAEAVRPPIERLDAYKTQSVPRRILQQSRSHGQCNMLTHRSCQNRWIL